VVRRPCGATGTASSPVRPGPRPPHRPRATAARSCPSSRRSAPRSILPGLSCVSSRLEDWRAKDPDATGNVSDLGRAVVPGGRTSGAATLSLPGIRPASCCSRASTTQTAGSRSATWPWAGRASIWPIARRLPRPLRYTASPPIHRSAPAASHSPPPMRARPRQPRPRISRIPRRRRRPHPRPDDTSPLTASVNPPPPTTVLSSNDAPPRRAVQTGCVRCSAGHGAPGVGRGARLPSSSTAGNGRCPWRPCRATPVCRRAADPSSSSAFRPEHAGMSARRTVLTPAREVPSGPRQVHTRSTRGRKRLEAGESCRGTTRTLFDQLSGHFLNRRGSRRRSHGRPAQRPWQNLYFLPLPQ
jgi:hypothetical protein